MKLGNKLVDTDVVEETTNYASQFELLKIVAELNHEMLFDYDLKKGTAVLTKVQNGRFVPIRNVSNSEESALLSFKDDIYEEDIAVLKRNFEVMEQKPTQNVIDFRFSLNPEEEKKWYRFFLVSEALEDGVHVDHIAGRLVCVDQEKQMNEMNRKKAELDALTGIYNHMTFESLGEKKLEKHKSETIFIMLDIDDFKMINDTQGHSVGDMVISQTGEVFQRMVKNRGIAGRLGGDEFAAIVWSFHSDEEIDDYMKAFQAELKTIIFDLEYSASIGVSIKHDRDMTFADMYYEADQGAYYAKKNGKNQIVYYDQISQMKEDISLDMSQNLTYENAEVKSFEEVHEMILIVDETNYQIRHVNSRFLKYFGLSYEEVIKEVRANEVLKISAEQLELLNQYEKYLLIDAEEEDNDFYRKVAKGLDAVAAIRRISWMDKSSLLLSILPVNDKEGLIQLLNRRSKVNNILHKTIEIIASGKGSERGPQALQLLVDYYDADCIAVIVERSLEKGEIIIEAHQEHAALSTKMLRIAVESGAGELFNDMFPKEGILYVPDLAIYKEDYPKTYEKMQELRMWSSVACSMSYQGEYCGKFLLINPRKHVEQRTMLCTIIDLIAAELLRAKKEIIHDYELEHDRLTGLLRRDYFTLIKEFWDADKETKAGVVYTDIIGMKEINSTFGYQKGNEYLIQTADLLKDIFGGYYLFRYEQDCLLAICPDIDRNIFDTLIETLKENFSEFGFGVAVGYSWGETTNLGTLIDEAKETMASDKQLQKYDNSILKKEHRAIIENMQKELEMGNFRVYLQPKVNIRTNELVGAEALCRYKDKVRGILSPALFVPMLEQMELIYMIDLFVLEEVFKFQKSRLQKGKKVIPISVNISKSTLLYSDFIPYVYNMVEKYDISTKYIEMEITESVGDMDHVLVAKIAKNLHTIGFSLAMDDFGTQYSNLAMLSQFEFDTAKIDRSIVKDIKENPKTIIILKHLTSMIREIGITCLIEGVETPEDLELIKQTDCDYVQGYCFGKPVPVPDFEEIFMDSMD